MECAIRYFIRKLKSQISASLLASPFLNFKTWLGIRISIIKQAAGKKILSSGHTCDLTRHQPSIMVEAQGPKAGGTCMVWRYLYGYYSLLFIQASYYS